jgi:carbonyl reductase 1
VFHILKLDLADAGSIQAAAEIFRAAYPDGLDILVNNAGFAYGVDSAETFSTQAEVTVRVNFTGTVAVCEAFLPLMNPHGRIVNVSSMAGTLDILNSDDLRHQFEQCTSGDQLRELVESFIWLAKSDEHEHFGWPSSAYGVSKLAVTTYTRILAGTALLQQRQIQCFACCPGWCQTDMTRGQGVKTASDGAQTPLWLALDERALALPNGSFIRDVPELKG